MPTDKKEGGLEAISKGEMLERFGCAAGPEADCGNFEACAHAKAWKAGYFVEDQPADDAPKITGKATG